MFAAVAVGFGAYMLMSPEEFDLELGGHSVLYVPTGSMDGGETDNEIPTIEKGSAVLVEKADVSGLKVGDVITYDAGPLTVVHRIKEIRNDGSLVVKGDANYQTETIDGDQVTGKVVYASRELGMMIETAKSPWLLLGAAALCAGLSFYCIGEAAIELKRTRMAGRRADEGV